MSAPTKIPETGLERFIALVMVIIHQDIRDALMEQ